MYKRPEILSNRIISGSNLGTFGLIRRKVPFFLLLTVPTEVGGNILNVCLAVPTVVGENILDVFLRTYVQPWSIRTGSHLIDVGLLLGPHRSND